MSLIATLLAIVITVPHIGWDDFDLDQQMAYIDQVRAETPIVLPVQDSTWRVAPNQQVPPLPPATVETLVRRYFDETDVVWALRVSYCESNWDAHATNPTSGAAGLFQHMPQFWVDRSARAGWTGADIFDAEANTAVAAWLYYTGGPQHWECR